MTEVVVVVGASLSPSVVAVVLAVVVAAVVIVVEAGYSVMYSATVPAMSFAIVVAAVAYFASPATLASVVAVVADDGISPSSSPTCVPTTTCLPCHHLLLLWLLFLMIVLPSTCEH